MSVLNGSCFGFWVIWKPNDAGNAWTTFSPAKTILHDLYISSIKEQINPFFIARCSVVELS